MSPSKSRRRRPLKRKSNTKKIILIVGFLAVVAATIGVVASMIGTNNSEPMKVRLVTNVPGDIVIELRDDMPITTGNFKKLVEAGIYDGTIFHRVVDGFVIQGGQVNSSVPSIPSEVIPGNNRNNRGTVAMALVGDPPDPDSASGQFFINLADNNNLDSNFAVFGKVVEGMDVVDEIAKVETDENDKPIYDVRIIVAVLEE